MPPKVKICGVTKADEIRHLDNHGVTYAGLWHGIPNGKYNLSLSELESLSSIPVKNIIFTLVTMKNDLTFLKKSSARRNIGAVQLHGFTLPKVIKQLKNELGSETLIFKVIHIKNNQCLEEGFIERYIDSGVDVLVIDSYQDKINIGSTGIKIDNSYIKNFISTWGDKVKIMVAGGINEHNISKLINTSLPFGIDIDSAARQGVNISENRIKAIMSNIN